MKRLIDANALEPDTEWDERYDGFLSYSQAQIDAAPTVWAKPVKHCKWTRKSCMKQPEYDRTTDLESYAHRCSNCNQVSYFPIQYPDSYCRRCGADMRTPTDLDEVEEIQIDEADDVMMW